MRVAANCGTPCRSNKEDNDGNSFPTLKRSPLDPPRGTTTLYRHTSVGTHTTPHSIVEKGSRVPLRTGLDQECVFLLVFLSFFQSGLVVPSKQTGPRSDSLASAVPSSAALRAASSRWRCTPRGPGRPTLPRGGARLTGKSGSGFSRTLSCSHGKRR